MDHPLIDLINAKIAAAEKDGAFDDLQGAGKPLSLQGDPEAALFDRVMKESGAVPEPVAVKRDIADLRAELLDTADRTERTRILARIAVLETRLDGLLSRG